MVSAWVTETRIVCFAKRNISRRAFTQANINVDFWFRMFCSSSWKMSFALPDRCVICLSSQARCPFPPYAGIHFDVVCSPDFTDFSVFLVPLICHYDLFLGSRYALWTFLSVNCGLWCHLFYFGFIKTICQPPNGLKAMRNPKNGTHSIVFNPACIKLRR